MKTGKLLVLIACVSVLCGCEENSVTTGPTQKAPRTGGSTTTTTVEEPNPVNIDTKPGSQNQNSLPHGQSDSSRY